MLSDQMAHEDMCKIWAGSFAWGPLPSGSLPAPVEFPGLIEMTASGSAIDDAHGPKALSIERTRKDQVAFSAIITPNCLIP